jgi:ATP-dependent helicase/nuclease subunit A
MMLPNDHDSRELALNINQSFIVQAPAGSGKTSLLTKRFLKLLLTVQQPEQVLALTFTKKAAGEMRDRVLAALLNKESTIAQEVLAHSELHNWQILQNPNRIKIKTFDSLCAFIVAKRPFLSGFGATMNVTNFVEQLYQQSVINLLQKVKDLPDYQQDFITVFKHFDNDRARLAQLLESLIPTRQQWLELILNVKKQASDGKDALLEYLNDNLQIVRENFIHDANHCLQNIEAEFLNKILHIAFCEGLLPEVSDLLDLEQLLIIKDLLLTKDGSLRKNITVAQNIHHAPHKQELKKILTILSANNSDFDGLHNLGNIVPLSYAEQQIEVLIALANVLLLLIAEFDLQTFESNEVDFAQIAIAASNALGHMDAPSELALELDYNIQHILVDEFQDTSYSQFRILQQLTNDWDEYPQKTVFFVGDPMQSIYRFRQANVNIFLNVKENGFNNLKVQFIALSTNFRATKTLVDWTNMICSQIFPKYDDYQLGAVSFAPSTAIKSHDDHSTVKGFFAQDQAAHIVKLIHEHKGGSIAILVRARTHLPQIIKALNQQHIGYTGVDIGLLIDKPIVQNLLIITKALADFSDQISWLALLRLPWIGLSLHDLKIISKQTTTVLASILTQIELSTDGMQRLNALRPIISEAYFSLANLSLSALVHFVFMNLTQNLKITKSEMFEVTSYLKFLSQLEVEYSTLTAQIIESRLSVLYINYGSHDLSLIQVMTIHKAKGLEFDTVIIPYLDRYLQNDHTKLLVFDEQIIAHIKDASEQSEPIYNYLKQKDAKQNNFEAKRLLYVALTRAKKNIYLLSEPLLENKNPNKNSFLAFFGGFVNSFVEIEHTEAKGTSQSLVYKRIPLSKLNYDCKKINNLVAPVELVEVRYFDPNAMRLTGIALHEILRYVANLGIENINTHEMFIPYIKQSLASNFSQNFS